MKYFLTLSALLFSFLVASQTAITYPYNPDGNADTLIGVTDMQDLLSTYGQPFFPSEILVDGHTLTSVLTNLQQSIDSLSAMSDLGGGSVLDMPIGTILPVAGEAVPEGWVLCDGRELAIEDYQGLYDLIGTTYGAGDSAFWAQVFYPATTFNIPDLRGRTIIGANDMGGEQSDVLTIHQASAGQVGGEEMHQLTEPQLPQSSFSIPTISGESSSSNQGANGVYYSGNGTGYGAGNFELGLGEGHPHNNMQPYMALNYMMKVQASENVIVDLQEQIQALESQLIDTQAALDSTLLEVDSLKTPLSMSYGYRGDWTFPTPVCDDSPWVDVILDSIQTTGGVFYKLEVVRYQNGWNLENSLFLIDTDGNTISSEFNGENLQAFVLPVMNNNVVTKEDDIYIGIPPLPLSSIRLVFRCRWEDYGDPCGGSGYVVIKSVLYR